MAVDTDHIVAGGENPDEESRGNSQKVEEACNGRPSPHYDYILIPYYLHPRNKLRPVFKPGNTAFPEGHLKMLNSRKPASWDLMRLFRMPPFNVHFGHCELTEVWLQEMTYPADETSNSENSEDVPFPSTIPFVPNDISFNLHEPIYGQHSGVGRLGVPEIIMVIAPPDRFCLPPPMKGCSRLS